jgi:glycosyltransferase involved in cell wall biosynthesis
VDYIYISITAAFIISLLWQLYYILVVHRKLAVFRIPDSDTHSDEPVSVIICARNEIENLKLNLIPILEQDYSDFEVIVVNDCSNDGSDWYLRDLSAQYKRLKVVTIDDHPRFKHGKKFAVTLGIKAAKNENLLFTDADCKPASDQWIKIMQSNFNDQTEIVLGYSPYEFKGGLLNRFIRFETFITALNYLSYAIMGNPYMGIGRNMAYKKSLFFRGKGFAAHMHILSGDDDLFVNQNANRTNTRIEIHPDTHVWSEPKMSFSAFFSQKIRHQGAGKAYKNHHKKMLSLQIVSAILFYLLMGVLLIIKADWWLIVSVYSIRLLVQIIVYLPALKRLKYADLIWFLPLFDFIYYIYIMLLSFITLFRKKVEWK